MRSISGCSLRCRLLAGSFAGLARLATWSREGGDWRHRLDRLNRVDHAMIPGTSGRDEGDDVFDRRLMT
jgi:hypothetical protein